MDEKQKAEIERQVAQIQQKIARLQFAKNKLSQEIEKLDLNYNKEKRKVASDEASMEWQGTKRKIIRTYVNDAYLPEYWNYVGKVNNLIALIDLKISGLEQQCSRLKEA